MPGLFNKKNNKATVYPTSSEPPAVSTGCFPFWQKRRVSPATVVPMVSGGVVTEVESTEAKSHAVAGMAEPVTTESRLCHQLAKVITLLEMLDDKVGPAKWVILDEIKAICQEEPELVRFTEERGYHLIDVFLEKQSLFVTANDQAEYQSFLAFLLGSIVNPKTADVFAERRLDFTQFCLTVLPAFEVYPHLLKERAVMEMFEAKRPLRISLKEYATMLDGLEGLWPHLRESPEIKKLMIAMRPPDLKVALKDFYATEGHGPFHSKETGALTMVMESYAELDLPGVVPEGPAV